MRIKVWVLGLTIVLAHTIGAVEAGAQPLKRVIEARNKTIASAVAAGDAAAVAAVYTQDAETVTPHDRVKTRESIEQMWKTIFGRGVVFFETTTNNVDLNDGQITETGTYVTKAKDGKVVERGAYRNVWVRDRDGWMILQNKVLPDASPK